MEKDLEFAHDYLCSWWFRFVTAVMLVYYRYFALALNIDILTADYLNLGQL